jgi:hypothetical protein
MDERIVSLSIEVNGKLKTYTNLCITAVGVKYMNPIQDQAEITIYNLDKATQDYLLTETSPYNFNRTPKTVILQAGRKSYGSSVIYRGNIIYCGVTQPPDIGVSLRCLTGNFYKNFIISRTQPGTATLEQLSTDLAQSVNAQLSFEATNKNIASYAYSGSRVQEIENLAALGQLDVFLDGNILVVKDAGSPRRGGARTVSAKTGMIGIPEFTERGVRVKFFIDNKTLIGGALYLDSEIYPAVNGGPYIIYQLGFQVCNRLPPFYYIADCQRPPSGWESTNG